MRLAILSDIHGNPLALDAVLTDIQRQGKVDAYWVLGDFAAIGYDPVTPLEKVTALPHASFTRGNTDRYVVTEDLPVQPEKALADPALLPEVIEAIRSFSWTRGYLSAAGWLDWLTNLPLEVRLTLPDGTRLLGVHASPGRDDGPGIQPKHSDDKLEQRLAGCEADLVIVGHTHVPLDRQVGRIHAINLGSISNPVTSGLQATYVLLDADENGYSVQLRRVDYDREAVIKAIKQSRHPTPSFLIGFMLGERVSSSDPGFFQAGSRAENRRNKERTMDRSHFLVETDWLAAHLQDAQLRIVDMRGYVRTVERDGVQHAEYVGARDEYEQAHIPGAMYIDWTRDIVDLHDPVEAQIAPPERFAETMQRLGIGDQHLVVAYDAHPASQFATRLWWALNYYGHTQVVVLNGGLRKWQREKLPTEAAIPAYPPATFTPRVQPQMRATAEEVLAILGKPGVVLIDARERSQYTGTLRREHGRPGHIPGALSIPREELIDATSGTFRSNEELAQVFAAAHVIPSEQVIAYCNGGVAATTILFGLAMLGYPALTNYDGSWNEWGVRQDLPVELA